MELARRDGGHLLGTTKGKSVDAKTPERAPRELRSTSDSVRVAITNTTFQDVSASNQGCAHKRRESFSGPPVPFGRDQIEVVLPQCADRYDKFFTTMWRKMQLEADSIERRSSTRMARHSCMRVVVRNRPGTAKCSDATAARPGRLVEGAYMPDRPDCLRVANLKYDASGRCIHVRGSHARNSRDIFAVCCAITVVQGARELDQANSSDPKILRSRLRYAPSAIRHAHATKQRAVVMSRAAVLRCGRHPAT